MSRADTEIADLVDNFLRSPESTPSTHRAIAQISGRFRQRDDLEPGIECGRSAAS
jgi:hypothetical protein